MARYLGINMKRWDLVVIGAGPAGYVAAIRASQLGMKVAVIDERELPGGTCLNVGCIPSKALLHATELYEEMSHKSETFGLLFESASVDFSKMQQFKESVVDSLGHGVLSLFEKNGIHFIKGRAVLKEANWVQVGEELLETERVLLAMGSFSSELKDLAFDEKRVLSSTGALNLDHIPLSMIVVGAGAIGLELASVYRRLGTQVTVLESASVVCPFLDPDISLAMTKSMRKQGLDIVLEAQIEKVTVGDSVCLEATIKDQKRVFEAEVILVAIGRRAATHSMGLEEVGVKMDERSRIIINDHFQTNIPSIFAVGDLVEGAMLAHKASEEAVVAVECMAGLETSIHYASIPNVIYTNPEIACVGFTEPEVRAAQGDCLVASIPMRFNARAKCSNETEGLIKIVASAKTHRILGVHIMSAKASEMISAGVLCMKLAMTLEDLAGATQSHPTLSESLREVALKALGRDIHS